MLQQAATQLQIPAQALQNMLPGPYRLRITDHDGLPCMQRAKAVGYQPVLAPVATADGVARPGGSHSHLMVLTIPVGRKK